MQKKFFTYVDFTTKDETPRAFYVGKGDIDRVSDLERNSRHKGIVEKYGQQRFIVYETLDENYAFEKEVELIAELKTNQCRCSEGHWGANFTDGGEGTSGHLRSLETRMKMCGRKPTQETREKLRLAASNRSTEYREKMSRANHGRKHSMESRKNMSLARKLRDPMTDETKLKMSKSQLGRKKSSDHREKIRQSNLGKKRSQETCEKIKKARKFQVFSEETRNKLREATRQTWIKRRLAKQLQKTQLLNVEEVG